jgi:hypothetical protein
MIHPQINPELAKRKGSNGKVDKIRQIVVHTTHHAEGLVNPKVREQF